ncbi:peptidoglycan/LPS O-acetylase OafA/YrhL [Rhodococcus sp. 27YEA15]|uniref:hypothetical protein n=1 Tax=Rhodococcus sp. 27YEA15 TaxID=3156259 RepID=UPI003C7D135A
MTFNLVVTAILAAASMTMVGSKAAAVSDEHGGVFLLLMSCLVIGVVVTTWRVVNRRQEPAVFAAVTYLAFGVVVAISEALVGDLVRAAVVGVSLILAVALVEDRRTRRWINRLASGRPDR